MVSSFRLCRRWNGSWGARWSERSASCRRSSSRTTRTTTSASWRWSGCAGVYRWPPSSMARAAHTDLKPASSLLQEKPRHLGSSLTLTHFHMPSLSWIIAQWLLISTFLQNVYRRSLSKGISNWDKKSVTFPSRYFHYNITHHHILFGR